jgi:hypothetical protein
MVNQFLRTSHDTLNRMQSSSTPESSMSSSSASTAVTNASLDQRLIAREPVTSSTMADTNSNNNTSASSSSSSATPIQSKPHASPLNQPTVIIDDLSDIEVSPQRGTTSSSSNKNNNNTLYAQPSEQVRHYKLSILIGFDTTVPIMQSINRTTHLAMASRCLHLPMMMTITVMTTLSTSS